MAARRVASIRARPMAVPLTVAHSTASQTSTSGSAGFAGGFLPVAAFQDVFRPFFAIVAAISAAASERMLQNFELSFCFSFFWLLSLAMSCLSGHSGEYPITLVRRLPGAEGGSQTIGVTRRDEPVRRAVVGIEDGHQHRPFQVGPGHQERPGVRVDPVH